jgi:HAD superfamily hydrolase (TIGR01509 family)
MSIQAVVFDLEGVLVDSEGYWLEARQDFARARGKAWTLDDQRQAMGRNTLEWAQVVKDRLAVDGPVEAIAAETIRGVIARYERRLPVLPGAPEAVRLAASRYRVALASGSPREVIHRVLTLTGLADVFAAIIYGDDMAVGKPAPDIYLEAARQLGVESSQAVGVEDSANGIRAVKAAGMRVIVVANPAIPLPDGLLEPGDPVLASLEAFSLPLVDGLSG